MKDSQKITATILFADIKGFSRLTLAQKLVLRRRVEPQAMDRVKRVLGDEAPLYFNSWGDAYLLVFGNVAAGTRAAFELRDGFIARSDWLDLGFESPLTIRCALHVGDIVIEKFLDPFTGAHRLDVVGDNIDLAARIEPVTEPGRIWATDTVANHLRNDRSVLGIECDSLGRRPLAKGWHPRPLFDLRRTNEKPLQKQAIPPDRSMLEHVSPEDIMYPVRPKRALFVIVGPSAVGKDAVASRLRGRLVELGIQARFANKYTTRKPRPGEPGKIEYKWHDPSSQYTYFNIEKFESNTDIVGRYEKFNDFYGFSNEHLASDQKPNRILICIFGDLDSIDEFVEFVEHDYNRDVLVFLLNAPREELNRRLDTRRGMDPKTIHIRKAEMIRDVARIRRIRLNKEDYVLVENANIDNPDDVTEHLLQEMLKYLGLLKRDDD